MQRSINKPIDAMHPRLREVRKHADAAAALLKALANQQRLQVLCALVGGPLPVSEIHRSLDLSQSALSQHLAVLRAAGVVRTSRRSQAIIYELNEGPALGVIRALYEAYCRPRVRRSGGPAAAAGAPGEVSCVTFPAGPARRRAAATRRMK